MDFIIYAIFILLFIVLWRHFTKKFLSEEGLKWHAYMVSTNLSIFVSISFLIIAFEIKSWLLDETSQQQNVIDDLNKSVNVSLCRDMPGKSVQVLYELLQSYKSKQDFIQHGFLVEPYRSWYQQIRCIQLLRPKTELEFIAADLLLLATEYRAQNGNSNAFTQKKEQQIQSFIDENPKSSQTTRRRKL